LGFVKVVKNRPYFKRFQVKYRRRREGKTDYQARRALVAQDKNKYNSKKYRLVVRFTNKDIIAQIIYSEIVGDKVMTAAYAHELPRYGVSLGLTNYAAAYCVGLLLARRHLSKLGLADTYKGRETASGEDFNVSTDTERDDNAPNPFKAILDVGLVRTTTGARVFSAMKGATDGGLDVPHSVTRFAGYDSESKTFNPDTLRKYIFGGHISEYMTSLKDSNPERYRSQFGRFEKNGVTGEQLEEIYTKAHAAIRANPAMVKTEKKVIPDAEKNKYKKRRISYAQRKDRIRQKKASAAAKNNN
jgi:large subunit ribosomal protein L5e